MVLSRPYSYFVDWWQLGIVIFEMLTARTPFYSRSVFETHRNVLTNHLDEFPLYISNLARYTCRILLQPKIKVVHH